ncbi:MAG: hypothetical protein IPN61_09005 [Bacteroidetes bacterium]|nr:hypothetical protein [Bacteroidota bacterium]MBK8364188.1 hypothetical protein [Bacteroidota bacterium]MBK9413544.1 hypothetical protein [Bacteroidota bacterium]
MNRFNSSATAILHLAAWLIFLPLLLFALFNNVAYTNYFLNSQDDKLLLALLVGLIGAINSGILIPRILYFKKIRFYSIAAALLVFLSAVFDFTLSSAISPVLSYIESISWTRVSALSAALVISTSLRIILDQNKNQKIFQD